MFDCFQVHKWRMFVDVRRNKSTVKTNKSEDRNLRQRQPISFETVLSIYYFLWCNE